MTDVVMADFAARAEALSFEDTIALIAMLTDKLRRQFITAKEQKAAPAFVDEIFAIADKEPGLHKSTGRWTRDELHRY